MGSPHSTGDRPGPGDKSPHRGQPGTESEPKYLGAGVGGVGPTVTRVTRAARCGGVRVQVG